MIISTAPTCRCHPTPCQPSQTPPPPPLRRPHGADLLMLILMMDVHTGCPKKRTVRTARIATKFLVAVILTIRRQLVAILKVSMTGHDARENGDND